MKRFVALLLVVVLTLSIASIALAGGEYVVIGGRLNLRKDATTSSTIKLYIPNNTPVDDKSSSASKVVSGWKYIGSWGYLSGESSGYNHYENGWVMSKFLAKT